MNYQQIQLNLLRDKVIQTLQERAKRDETLWELIGKVETACFDALPEHIATAWDYVCK